MSGGSPNQKPDSSSSSSSRDSTQRGGQENSYKEILKDIKRTIDIENKNSIHISKFEAGTTIGVLAFGLWVLGIWLEPPENQIVYIAFASAVFTYLTFLGTRAARRRKVRLTLRAELREHQSFIDDLADQFEKPLEEADIRHTHLPTKAFESQTAQLGYLSQKEINAVSEYYTLVEIYQALLEGSENTKELWERLDFGEEPIPTKLVDQLEKAREAIGSIDPEVERSNSGDEND